MRRRLHPTRRACPGRVHQTLLWEDVPSDAPNDPAGIHVVVARYREDLDWLADLNDLGFRSTVYVKCQDTPLPLRLNPSMNRFIVTPNVGREAETFVQHIVANYDDLDPLTVFLQGDPWPHMRMRAVHPRAARVRALATYLKSHAPGPVNPFLVIRENHAYWQDNRDKIEAILDGDPNPKLDSYTFAWGAQYMVRREDIRRLSRDRWSFILSKLRSGEYDAEAMERLWMHFFFFS